MFGHSALQREGSRWSLAARHRRGYVVEGLWEHRKMARVAAIEVGAKEKHSAPRVWPWCKETTTMARERRATRGRLTERICGPRTHEDGGAGGALRRCAGLQPIGRLGERGSPVERRGKQFTIPLHKVSRRYVECSPRRNSLRSGLEDCNSEVDVVGPEPVVGRRARGLRKGEGGT